MKSEHLILTSSLDSSLDTWTFYKYLNANAQNSCRWCQKSQDGLIRVYLWTIFECACGRVKGIFCDVQGQVRFMHDWLSSQIPATSTAPIASQDFVNSCTTYRFSAE
jgi:hypothetical protein